MGMTKRRYPVACPWCGAKLERLPKADRIREKRPPGSRIEKDIAKCPECSRILLLKEAARDWRRVRLLGACALALALGIGIMLLIFLMRT